MSKYEESAYPVGKTKTDLAGLKRQLSHLKDDLERFLTQKPGGALIAPLRERIRALDAEIAEAEESKVREKREKAGSHDSAEAPEGGTSMRPTAGRFPPRRR